MKSYKGFSKARQDQQILIKNLEFFLVHMTQSYLTYINLYTWLVGSSDAETYMEKADWTYPEWDVEDPSFYVKLPSQKEAPKVGQSLLNHT